MTTSWRMFCAVELPAEVRVQMQHHIERLRREVPDASASWSRVENIHLTLKFFGNVPVERIDTISNAIGQAVKGFQPFEISVGNTGVFPRASRPQVLWVGVGDSSGKLAALNARLEDACATVGFEKEGRAFRPHLTIARLRKPEGARRLTDAHLQQLFEPVEVRVREVVGFRSELSSKGSKYTAIFNHRLHG